MEHQSPATVTMTTRAMAAIAQGRQVHIEDVEASPSDHRQHRI
jgi:hypothetical protein